MSALSSLFLHPFTPSYRPLVGQHMAPEKVSFPTTTYEIFGLPYCWLLLPFTHHSTSSALYYVGTMFIITQQVWCNLCIVKPLTFIITAPTKLWCSRPKDWFLLIDYATKYNDTGFIFKKTSWAISQPLAGISIYNCQDIHAWNPIHDSNEFCQYFNICSSVLPATTQQISHLLHKHWDCFYTANVKFPSLHLEFTANTRTS